MGDEKFLYAGAFEMEGYEAINSFSLSIQLGVSKSNFASILLQF